MGIAYHDAAFLAKAKKNKANFRKILTIGHQLLFLSQNQIEHLAKLYGINIGTAKFTYKEYADNFLRIFLGAKEVKSLDYSDYEGCDIVHDMNKPISSKYHEVFDVVIDGGSLEHIFNFPIAIENCMKMVKKEGSIFMFSLANNHLGHGFYQFSPELFFRIFHQTNGFRIKEIILVKHPFPGPELSSRIKCYTVVDPALAKKRVCLVTKNPVSIIVHAVRTEVKPIFSKYPIQSDYLATYNQANNQQIEISFKNFPKYLIKKYFPYLPLSLKNYIQGKRELFINSFSNKRFFKKIQLF